MPDRVLPAVHYDLRMGSLPYEVEFDVERYAELLEAHGATAEQIGRLAIHLTAWDDMSTRAGYDIKFDTGIRLNFYHFESLDASLRHETRHFIDHKVEGKRPIYNRVGRWMGRITFATIGLAMVRTREPVLVGMVFLPPALWAKNKLSKALYEFSPFENRARRFEKEATAGGPIIRAVPATSTHPNRPSTARPLILDNTPESAAIIEMLRAHMLIGEIEANWPEVTVHRPS